MNEVQFHGPEWAGSFEFAMDGWMIFSCPSDIDSVPHMVTVALDPTPEQGEAIASAILEWAAIKRAAMHTNSQSDLLGIL